MRKLFETVAFVADALAIFELLMKAQEVFKQTKLYKKLSDWFDRFRWPYPYIVI